MQEILPSQPKYRLGKIPNKYLILDIIFFSYYKQKGFKYLLKVSKSFRQLLRENYEAALKISEDALSHLTELPCTISQIDLPVSDEINIVDLSEDRLYA